MDNLLGLKDLSLDDIMLIFEQAKIFKSQLLNSDSLNLPLQGKKVVNFFAESSTRTKASFEIAITNLGAYSINLDVALSSLNKGETLLDTAKNLEAMGIDALVIRHQMSGTPNLLSNFLKIPIINAGDGLHEHPTQALLDIYTMLEHNPTLKDKEVVLVGDIAHSRVARSNIWGLLKFGAKVTVVGPPMFIPHAIEKLGVEISYNLEDVLPKADFINVLRLQLERQGADIFPSAGEYIQQYGLSEKILSKAKKNIVIMHPGPINRGVEIESAVADGPYNVILNQVQNGVAIRMAIMYLLL